MISIVIPTLNEGGQLGELAESLTTMSGVGEVIIVDASDQPESRAALEQLPLSDKLRRFEARRKGRAAQMNQGASHCRFDRILFLHSDSHLPEAAVQLIEDALNQFRWGRFDIKLDAPGCRFRVIEFMIGIRSRLTRIATGDQGIFVWREFFLEQNGYVDIALMEDIEFSRRIGAISPPALITVPIKTSARRWINHGTLRTILLMWKLRILYRLGVNPDRLAAIYRDAR